MKVSHFASQDIKQGNILLQIIHVQKGFHLQKQQLICQDGVEI